MLQKYSIAQHELCNHRGRTSNSVIRECFCVEDDVVTRRKTGNTSMVCVYGKDDSNQTTQIYRTNVN